MLRSLAAWCYRRRRLVVVTWIVALIGVSVLGQTVGGDLLKTFSLPGTESQATFDVLKQQFSRSGDTGNVVFEGARQPHGRRSRSPAGDRAGVRGAAQAAARRERDEPVRAGREPVHRAERQDRLRGDPVRRAGERRTGRSRDAHALDREGRELRRRAGRARGQHVHRADDARERAHRHPRRGHHPADRVRLAARDGLADHDRVVRHRHRSRRRQPARARAGRPVVRAAGHRDDRYRCRHRLRAVHQHPLPRGAARRRSIPNRPSCTRSTRAAGPCCSRVARS